MSAETDKLIDEYLRSRNVPLLGLGDEVGGPVSQTTVKGTQIQLNP